MTEFEQLREIMDAEVDTRLGDSITYIPSGGSPRVIAVFILQAGGDMGIDGVDPIRNRYGIKVSKAQMPVDGPSRGDRLEFFDRIFRPSVDTVTEQEHYWLFDVQLAPVPAS